MDGIGVAACLGAVLCVTDAASPLYNHCKACALLSITQTFEIKVSFMKNFNVSNIIIIIFYIVLNIGPFSVNINKMLMRFSPFKLCNNTLEGVS